MIPIEYQIKMKKKTDRIELFPLGDLHIGKSNCNEEAIKKQVREIVRRSQMPDRHVRVIFGGDICEFIKPGDRKRYNTNAIADWVLTGTPDQIRKRLNNVATEQLKRAVKILEPIKHLAIGAVEGNHEYSIMHYDNLDVQNMFCDAMGIPNLSDESLLRLNFIYTAPRAKTDNSTNINIYIQHGCGGGRSVTAEPLHLARLRDKWEDAEIVLRGHSHTFCVLEPKPVKVLPKSGVVLDHLLIKHRYGANWGCWNNTHQIGNSTYESRASYPDRAMMSVKVVIWPMFRTRQGGTDRIVPKLEVRSYPIM